jgi:hypothetical protein
MPAQGCSKPEIRTPQWVCRRFEKMQVKSRAAPMIRHSGFGFLSDFGFQTSDFGLKQLRPDSAFITMGGTGHWPVPSGDPPDGTGEALCLPADTIRHWCFIMLSSFNLRPSSFPN